MNQTELINEYVNQLANNYKQAMIDKVMMTTQINLLQKQVEDLTKQLQEKIDKEEKVAKKNKKESVEENLFTN
jgi:predicted nucleic acid-binding protein